MVKFMYGGRAEEERRKSGESPCHEKAVKNDEIR